MAQDHADYLAINVLNEQLVVSYRMLSRALKVHSNLAKQMLYEFHKKQNGKKAGRVHATYLVSGLKRPEQPVQANGSHVDDTGDTVMQSSPPFPGSSAPKQSEEAQEAVPFRSMMMVREEHLEKAKATFESITGIHIYSLQPNGLSDLQSLTECNRTVAAGYILEDPLQAWKQYGIIQNPNAKRRAQRRPLPVAVPAAEDTKGKPKPSEHSKPPAAIEKQASKDSQDSKAGSRPTSANEMPELEKAKLAKPPITKRQNSDIFKSFAKAKPPLKRKTTESSNESAAALAESTDEPSGAFSDDEQADEDVPMEDVADAKAPGGKSKNERKADLEAMMDAEDELVDDAPASIIEEMDDEDGAIDKSAAEAEAPRESVTSENGRRRGRRRIMKKKTVKDEDGYLVTKEEAAWESFSEDEPAPKKLKVPPAIATSKSATTKKGGRPGQGNIMSFFGKK